ncbi:MAG: CAAX prenyl protease-related protein [Burkholderiales bacterium]
MSPTSLLLHRVRRTACPAIARTVPFALYIAVLMGASFLEPRLPDPRWLYLLQVAAPLLALAFFAPGYTELRSPGRAGARVWALAVAVGFAVFMAWIHLDVRWLSFGQAGGFDPTLPGGGFDWPWVVLRLAGAVLVVPVMEELFWRSFVMRVIDRADFLRMPPVSVSLKALIVSSLLFGVEHSMWFAGILAGLAYGWLYLRSGNLWVPVAAHALTNLLLGLWVLSTGHWQFW